MEEWNDRTYKEKMINQLIEMETYKSDDGRQLYELTKEELEVRISKSI